MEVHEYRFKMSGKISSCKIFYKRRDNYEKAFVLTMMVAIATVFFLLPGTGIVGAQTGSGGASDQPPAPSAWAVQAQQADVMISEAQKTIQRCNEEIAQAEAMKKRAQEGRARAQALGGTKEDQPQYPWLSMEKAADKMIADARQTIERCELQIKTGKALKVEAENELKKLGQ